ncbi:MAG: transglycosylase SLT domain-containing protein [Dehalococcoidia bacterium]|nr:transglycosylase SLT domain-containing protein [Dehalococcoidia bacterium]
MWEAAEQETPDVLASLGRDALKIVIPLGVLVFVPVLMLVALFGGLPESTRATGAPGSITQVPADHLEVMRQTSLSTGIPWQVFAAIAFVESGFGLNMGPSSAGAIGYCQFMPATWAASGVDGDGDGIADPSNYKDCIPAAARYLQANGAPADLRRAIYAYNPSWAYVEKVLAYSAAYGYTHSSSIPGRAVELARSKLGSPYVWGAAGPETFDCSGLVLWVYAQLGLSVPRTAQMQHDWAAPLETAHLQPGDLLFYEGTYQSHERITHVGIYAGGGSVIMATASGDFVKEVPLSDPYWRSHFASAGRPPYWEVSP